MTVSNESIAGLFENIGTLLEVKGDTVLAIARRAWWESGHTLNTPPRKQFLSFVRTPKPERLRIFDVPSQMAGVP